jgi:phosphoglycolate phosphatase
LSHRPDTTSKNPAPKQKMESPPIDGFIFDLDGTLLDTLASLANCYNRVLTQLGFATHATDAYRYFIGDGARRCVERCLPASARTSAVIDQALALQQQDYADTWQRDAQPYPGISALLQQLAHGPRPLAVLSNKDQAFTQLCVSHFFPDIEFQQVVGFSAGVPHKPDPTGALKIAEALGIPCQRLALIGDTAMDMETASTCQMQAVGVLWGFRERDELLSAGATTLLATPADLLQLA